MELNGVNDKYWVLTIYDGEDEIIRQEVIENEDEGVALNISYIITEGSDDCEDWSLMPVAWWKENLVVKK